MSAKTRIAWRRTFLELPERDTDANRTGVAFISVLFGIAFGQIATGSITPIRAILNGDDSVSAKYASAAHYGVGLVLTLTSFVGYFASRNGPQLRIKFFNLPFVQIALDAAMVILYFFVGVYANNGTRADAVVLLVFASFALYLCWDLVGLRLRRDPYSQLALGRAPEPAFGFRRRVTVLGLGISAAMATWVRLASPTHLSETSVVQWDVALVALLIAYRIAKSCGDTDIRYRDEPRDSKPHTPANPAVPLADWERIVPAAVRDDRTLLTAIVNERDIALNRENIPQHAAAERLRTAGAITLAWEMDHVRATSTEAGDAYIELLRD